jgi:hypothetical protein
MEAICPVDYEDAGLIVDRDSKCPEMISVADNSVSVH